ncbi:hypothetical protein PFICI_10856 [Pestalotiopsis fici W106-1]|uniref:Uncharacterized protein n=1 Tax=Pestalotiopsis fici (strain W106-1 / CGMCC3.15140) TaxID=1229662 RepID=W3WV13_PESFW|nr:uncharacterized protein PFICI_10856 [Pestalotiopsis fici W106-1]ETS76982.1 hypothetical protein PFICI_10856 [Pestalotiopsis fici W106-1]
MASNEDYSVGWACALPTEVEAAKATLDRIHDNLPPDQYSKDNNCYILGSLQGHNVVVAYPKSGVYGETSVADVVAQMHATFKSIRYSLLVGIAGGVPNTKEDVRLGDVVVSKSTAGRPGVVQLDLGERRRAEDQLVSDRSLLQPTPLLLTAMGKTETATIFEESKISRLISEIMQKDPEAFAHPGPEQDILFEPDYDHAVIETNEDGCNHCNPDRILPRRPRDTQDPVVHYGLIASGRQLPRQATNRDRLAQNQGVLCFDTETSGLKDAARYLVIRGICDYADSNRSNIWHAYAAVVAAAYAKEVLSFIPSVSKTISQPTNTYPEAVPILDALLLTRPEVDRKSLIALKGHRVDGTCEWLIQHPSYRKWLEDPKLPVLWVSGGPGKGKTMLAIYITEALQPVIDTANDVLLYYFCSNRDKNRNSAVTIMRGIIHQWIDLHPHLAQEIKGAFEGTETTKYTVSSFVSLWRVFLTMLRQSRSSQVVCVLDGMDECEKESLRQLLDAVGNHLSSSQESAGPRLKLIVLSRPQPAVLENKLGQYQQIKLDDSKTETSNDVERYILAKVAELATEQDLSEEMVARVRQALLEGADGTFLWVGFVANELQGRSWGKINEVLLRVPKGLGGVYQRILQQIDDKEALVPILQWVVLAARPLTVEELTVATGIKPSGNIPATEVVKRRLRLGGLLVKIEGDVVNLVHESAKEFFQSNQVNIKGINMFHMTQHTHRVLMQTCLLHLEHGYGASRGTTENSGPDPLLSYASQYWPMHFQHAIGVIDQQSEFSRPFFDVESTIREEWWKVYWELEKNGGNPPSFTLLHLAAYLGNIEWARLLISERSRLISRKDNYGRTPLSWAVNQGHRDMVDLLLDHGARLNFKDRSTLTALHIAVTGQHKDVVAVLLDHGARLETKTEHNDTALIRAIQANSKEIVQVLLEHGARVDELPTAPGVTLRGPADPMDERVEEILGLQEQIFLARYKQASRKVEMVMKAFSLSFRFPLIFQLVTLYLRSVALGRWENLSVLQELVRENRTDELRRWTERHREFFVQVVLSRNRGRLRAICELPERILSEVAPSDLQALLVISVMVGSEAKLVACREGWREGDAITSKTFSNFTALAYNRDAEEFLHQGVRDFLNGFDVSVQTSNRQDNAARTMVLLTSHIAMIENQQPKPIEYFARVIAEFFEGYIDSSYEVELFNDANQACANELSFIGKEKDTKRLLLLLTSIVEIAQRSQEKGQDRFLNIPSVSCLLLCQEDPAAHQWLIGEGIPATMSALIAKQDPGPLQKRACKTFVECLIIGKQYGLLLSTGALKSKVKQNLHALPEVENMMNRIIG